MTEGLYRGDCLDWMRTLPEGSVDLVFTDPPYAAEHARLYGFMAAEASRFLVPGGSLIAYVGTHSLPDVLAGMGAYLRFWWLLHVVHRGPQAELPGKWLKVGAKPLVWFVKEKRRCRNFVDDTVLCRGVADKTRHAWGQHEQVAAYYIGRLTEPGQLVVDPFLGGGTTAAAAVRLGRRWAGAEISADYWNVIESRVAESECVTRSRRIGGAAL